MYLKKEKWLVELMTLSSQAFSPIVHYILTSESNIPLEKYRNQLKIAKLGEEFSLPFLPFILNQ